MRFESVTAHAFGPLAARTLDLAPGLNVVYGPNEAGKSTWHAALYAGLCGMRRRPGKLPPDDEQLAARHRPWDGGPWTVEAIVALADRRRVALTHDLETRTGTAVDADFGRPWPDDLVFDGSVDGARLLGLDRRAFLATACIRQADILGLLDHADQLQEHLQRAAASAGARTTAARALDRIRQFQTEHVGTERAQAKPLRRAMDAAAEAERALERARRGHDDYLNLAAHADELAEAAHSTELALRLVEARRAAAEAEAQGQRLDRGRELLAHYPDRPDPLPDDDDSAQEIAAALAAWADRPTTPDLQGRPAVAVQADLDALPAVPVGDVEIDETVIAAHLAWMGARSILEEHERVRPSAPDLPGTGGADEQALHDLARSLDEPVPTLDPSLEQRRHEAEQRVQAASRAQVRLAGVLLGGGLVLVGLAVAALGLLVPGATLVGAGIIFLLLSRPRVDPTARLAAVEGLHAIEEEIGERRFVVETASRRRTGAATRARGLGLPTEPDALRALADRLRAAAEAQRRLAEWEQQKLSRQRSCEEALALLAETVERRGVPSRGGDVAAALERYKCDCAARKRLAATAAERPRLEAELAARRQLEASAREAEQRRRQAETGIGRVAARIGVAEGAPEALVAALHAWQEGRAGQRAAREAARQAWAEIDRILDGRTPAEIGADVERQRGIARSLAAELDPAQLAVTMLDPDVESQLQRLRRDLQTAAAARDQARGQGDERRSSLLSVPEAEEAHASAKAELEGLRQIETTLNRTREFLEAAQERAHRTIAPVLAESVRRRLPAVTANRYREVRVDPNDLKVTVRTAGGAWREARLLSHGTAEQVYLLLRVALTEHLTRAGEVCPLILDDVTVQSDAERTEAILRTLHTLSLERQVVLFTQEQEVLAWAEANLVGPADRFQRLDVAAIGV